MKYTEYLEKQDEIDRYTRNIEYFVHNRAYNIYNLLLSNSDIFNTFYSKRYKAKINTKENYVELKGYLPYNQYYILSGYKIPCDVFFADDCIEILKNDIEFLKSNISSLITTLKNLNNKSYLDLYIPNNNQFNFNIFLIMHDGIKLTKGV